MRTKLWLWIGVAAAIAASGRLTGTANAHVITFDDWETYQLGRDSPSLDGWEYVNDVASSSWNTIDYRGSAWIGNTKVGDNTYPHANSGEQFVDLNASYLWQNTGEKFIAGATYTLSLEATAATSGSGLYLYLTDHDPMEGPDLGTSLVVDYFDVPDTDFSWNEYTTSYTATADDAGKDIILAAYGRSATYIDDVQVVSTAPEPSSLTLAGIGLLGLLLVRRWRKH